LGRLLAFAVLYDGGKRTEAARIGDVSLQMIRGWGLRFSQFGLSGFLGGKAPGAPCKLYNGQRQAGEGIVESGPIPAIHVVAS
jgi:transposase